MKNHVWANGSLLQTNKKWSALKQSQRQWIQEITAEAHAAYVAEHGNLPMKKRKLDVISAVERKIDERGIWIPYGELKAHLGKLIDRLNHKSPLFVPPKPASKRVSSSVPAEIPHRLSQDERKAFLAQEIVCESERLLLRKLAGKDFEDIRKMLSDPDVMCAWERTYGAKHEVKIWISRQVKRYEKELVGYFAAVDKQSGKMIGQIGLMWNTIQGKRCLEVGYMLKKEHWRNGYATEGAKACLALGFELFGTDKIYATIRPENEASLAVAQRLGMALEGEFVKKFEGKRMRHLIFSASKL